MALWFDKQVFLHSLLNIYFQLLSANLPRPDDENNASCGYRENDIKLEVRRASRLVINMFYWIQYEFFLKCALISVFRRVFTVNREEQVSDVVWKDAKSRSIFHAVYIITAYPNLLAFFNPFAIYILPPIHVILRRFMNRMFLVLFATIQWVNTTMSHHCKQFVVHLENGIINVVWRSKRAS